MLQDRSSTDRGTTRRYKTNKHARLRSQPRPTEEVEREWEYLVGHHSSDSKLSPNSAPIFSPS